MPNETLDPYKIAEYMLKDYARAVSELERANNHLTVLFKAMHAGGLTKELLTTGLTPDMHWRLIEEHSVQLRSFKPSGGDKPCPTSMEQPSSSAGKSCDPTQSRSSLSPGQTPG